MAAPGGTGPIGPFPPRVEGEEAQEEYDKLRRRLLWTLPYGLYVVGSRAGERRNLMTLNWATQVSFEPKLFGIGVEKTALTHQLVADGGSFTLNTIARDDRAIVRKFTKPVEHDPEAGTLNGFAVHDGPTGAPVLDQAVAWLACGSATRSTAAATRSSSARSSTAGSPAPRTPRSCAWRTPA